MSELAVIRVVKCDGCQLITTLMTKQEYDNYEKNWFADIQKDFCPKCLESINELIPVLMEKPLVAGA